MKAQVGEITKVAVDSSGGNSLAVKLSTDSGNGGIQKRFSW